MAAILQIEVVSAEGHIFSGEGSLLVASGEDGDLGIAPGHAPLLTRLRPGELRVKSDDGDEKSFYVSGGILEVQPRRVTVLSDTVIRSVDLDEEAAMAAQREAEDALASQTDRISAAQARAELLRAVAQLKLIRKTRRP